MTKVAERIVAFIEKHNLLQAGEKLVVAVSGGADSVCLLHFLAQHQKYFRIELHVAHLNHQLRGADSDADAEYVSKLAHQLALPVTIKQADVKAYQVKKRCSLEEAAREVRYNFLAQVAKEVKTNRIAVGHTRDDHTETVLMHLIRGAGTTGLKGLEPRSEMMVEGQKFEVIRPLLAITREEAANYCQKHQLMPRSDMSNLSLAFFRNRIRLELLPLLRKYNPNFDEAIWRLSQIAGDEVSFLQEQAKKLWVEVAKEQNRTIYLDKAKIRALPQAMQRQLLRLALSRLLGNVKDIEAEHIEAILNLAHKPGKKLNLPRGLTFVTEYDQLILKVAKAFDCPFPILTGEFQLNIPGETILPGWRVVAEIITEFMAFPGNNNLVALFDFQKTGNRLLVRSRKPGDRFQPLGMKELKKLQDFMVDAKIPRLWRDCIPLVCSPEQILWVVGWRIDDRVKVTETTKEILRLQFEQI